MISAISYLRQIASDVTAVTTSATAWVTHQSQKCGKPPSPQHTQKWMKKKVTTVRKGKEDEGCRVGDDTRVTEEE